MPPRKPEPDAPAYIDEHHQRITEFANDYFDDDDERGEFVSTLMQRRGYKPVQHTSWEPPEPQDKGGQGGQGGQQRRSSFFKQA